MKESTTNGFVLYEKWFDDGRFLKPEFQEIRRMLLSGYINDTHTYVPGPDGKFGYGGKCFPKDVNAFTMMTKGTPLGKLLEPLHELNVHFRGFEEHI